jgi:hypothetical protein
MGFPNTVITVTEAKQNTTEDLESSFHKKTFVEVK